MLSVKTTALTVQSCHLLHGRPHCSTPIHFNVTVTADSSILVCSPNYLLRLSTSHPEGKVGIPVHQQQEQEHLSTQLRPYVVMIALTTCIAVPTRLACV